MSVCDIEKIKSAIAEQDGVLFAYLFGSQARGKASERSYFDIAVYLSGEGKGSAAMRGFYIEAAITRLLGTDDIQVVVLNGLDSPLFGFEVIKDGVLLVDRNTAERIEFEARILG